MCERARTFRTANAARHEAMKRRNAWLYGTEMGKKLRNRYDLWKLSVRHAREDAENPENRLDDETTDEEANEILKERIAARPSLIPVEDDTVLFSEFEAALGRMYETAREHYASRVALATKRAIANRRNPESAVAYVRSARVDDDFPFRLMHVKGRVY